MKKIIIILLSLFLLISFAFSANAKSLKFAFMPGIADPFYFTMEKGAKAKAKELGVELIVGEFPKAWGPEYQVPILKALVARGDIDLLFTAPTSTEALIPVLKEILAINPDIKILGSPWSPPTLMKTNGATKGGELKKEYYQAYAKYFVRYVQEMQKEGIIIDAIRAQFEIRISDF